jgi:hypothetical protein
MVMLKVLKQHHSATGDPRVIEVLLKYFRYQLRELPRTPLDHWSFWGNRRGGDNLMVVYWLYNLTGEPFLLELSELVHKQTFPYTDVFLNTNPAPSPDLAHLYPNNIDDRYPFNSDLIRRLSVDQLQSFHCVNLAQGIKAPLVYYQQNPDERFRRAVKQAFATIKRFHGQPQGMYGGDEPMHGNAPTQGVEFCQSSNLCFPWKRRLRSPAMPTLPIISNGSPTTPWQPKLRRFPVTAFPVCKPGARYSWASQLLREDYKGHRHLLRAAHGLPLLHLQHAPGLAQVCSEPVVRHG